jgi:hypothetical protein
MSGNINIDMHTNVPNYEYQNATIFFALLNCFAIDQFINIIIKFKMAKRVALSSGQNEVSIEFMENHTNLSRKKFSVYFSTATT